MKVNKVHFPTIESTNRWAMEHAVTLQHEELTIITADEQTAGYGRQGRRWVSPAGENLYATFCLFPTVPHNNLSFVMAIAILSLLEKHQITGTIKWPNDLLVKGKKIAGILCEAKKVGSQQFVAIGVGLNVNMTGEKLADIDRAVTSMILELNKNFNISSILEELTSLFLNFYSQFLREGFSPFVKEIRDRMEIDKLIHFHHGDSIYEGVVNRFNDDGSLTLILPDGTERTFQSGEVLYTNPNK